ncbi:hypothetical protein UPYG_G00337470 [Umbra pygmaea]|uniref:Uncharacterized protein n=1 Tax=Umbra pygmaea TaxID=75934 RepID=A0ABD0VX96_UMBPY
MFNSTESTDDSDFRDQVPGWVIALLVLASAILLLLIIIFIMLVVRWCCKKSKDVSDNNSTPDMDPYSTYVRPIPINEQTNVDPPKKNESGMYIVNP